MGSLRRKVSVVDVRAQPSLLVADMEGAVAWPELAEVDCGCCVLSFRSGGLELPGLACLHIRLNNKGWNRRTSVEFALTVLARVLSLGVDFVVTYDFRSHSPQPSFTQGLSEFFKEHKEQWSGRLKSAAVLVKDSIFDTAAQGPFGGFLQACELCCPFLVCHGEAAAEEFFRMGLASPPAQQDSSAAPFVSVVDVREAPRPDDPRTCASSRTSKLWQKMGCAAPEYSCIASLATLRSRQGSAEAFEQALTFHMLPIGDMRVIQSPPGDVVLRLNAERQQQARAGPLERKSAPERHRVINNSDLCTVAALK